jgi:hypothetical protein
MALKLCLKDEVDRTPLKMDAQKDYCEDDG